MSVVFSVPPSKWPDRPVKRIYPVFSREDVDLEQIKWHAGTNGHAMVCRVISGKPKTIYAHQVVLARKLGRWPQPQELTDHKDRNKLNNKRNNLRIATSTQNSQNRKVNSNSISGHRGVSWDKTKKKWAVQVVLGGKRTRARFSKLSDAVAKATQIRAELGFWSDK